MEFNSTKIGAMAKTAMSYNMQRQAEIGKNIANIDTPNYQAKDLKKIDFSKAANAEATRLEMRATASKHLQGTTAKGGAYADERNRHTFETTPVGNNVVLEEQMANINEIGLKYQLASSVYRKMNGLFKMAVNGK